MLWTKKRFEQFSLEFIPIPRAGLSRVPITCVVKVTEYELFSLKPHNSPMMIRSGDTTLGVLLHCQSYVTMFKHSDTYKLERLHLGKKDVLPERV
ncbi:hypothetical protein TNCV_4368711 [Trichonephila clavipes]|nr:hypothetical protein TNCV_4368711 [Trichonephila clavipes]